MILCFCLQTYAGLDVDRIKDTREREGVKDMIRLYGQTPKQLFLEPHPSPYPSSYKPRGNISAKVNSDLPTCFIMESRSSKWHSTNTKWYMVKWSGCNDRQAIELHWELLLDCCSVCHNGEDISNKSIIYPGIYSCIHLLYSLSSNDPFGEDNEGFPNGLECDRIVAI